MTAAGRCRICGGLSLKAVARGIRDWEYGTEGVFELWRCLDCGMVQLAPFPDLDLLKRAYDVPYHGYAETEGKGAVYRLLHRINEAALRRRMEALIPRAARLLDIGCGTGRFLARLSFLEPAASVGVDFSAVAVAAARRNGIDAHQGTFLELLAPERPYDAIFMNNYLEHTLDPSAELGLARRYLTSGGRLLGEVPNFASVDRVLFGRYWGGNHVPRHTFQFTPASLRRLLDAAGFEDVNIRQELNTGHWALSVQNYLQRGKPDLGANPGLRDGRAAYFGLLLIGFLPLNAVMAVLGLSSVIRFEARA